MSSRIVSAARIIGHSIRPATSRPHAGPSRIPPPVHELRHFESHSAALKRAEAARERAVQNPTSFKNDAIPYKHVRLVNSKTNRLEPETRLKDLLASVDLDTHFLQLVSPEPPDGGMPLVKIINKHEAAQKEREQKAKKKEQKKAASGRETKEIQLTWGAQPGDLRHKLDKAITELEKKNRVKVTFIPKKGAPVPSRDQMGTKMEHIWQAVKDVAIEYQPRMTGDLTGLMYLQGLGKPEK
jgi:translation initiation factor IF-3